MTREEIDRVKALNPIPDVLSSYGIPPGRNHSTICPFHKDTNPSLSYTDRLWNCHGCGKSGDVFTLIMELENTDFPGAAKLLAAKLPSCGMEQHTTKPQSFAAPQKPDHLWADFNDAIQHWRDTQLAQTHAQESIGMLCPTHAAMECSFIELQATRMFDSLDASSIMEVWGRKWESGKT